jgi:alpha-1,6-mannosyltransferase
MIICDLVQSFTARSGGIRTYIRAKQAYLARTGGHRHVLIMPGASDRTVREGATTVHEVRSPFIPGYRPYRFNVRVGRVAALLAAERPDVVELASPYLMPWPTFRHRQRHGPCAVVGYYHADFPEAYVAQSVASVVGHRPGRLAGRLAEAYARAVYDRCELTVTAAPTYRRSLEAMGIARVHEVPLGVDLEVFHPRARSPEIWDDLFPAAPAGPVLVYCGRLDREKQVEVLVAAHARLPARLGARLLLVGEGPLRPQLTALAGRRRRLQVVPFVSDRAQLGRLLASADLYVTAGPYETFGLSVLEAQASGLPVAGVAAGALPDRVPAGLGALAPPGDAAGLAAAIADQLACDPRARGLAARSWVEANFGWDKVFARLLGLYDHHRATARRGRPVRGPTAAAGASAP